MNWLIISTDESSQDARTIQSFLSEKKSAPFVTVCANRFAGASDLSVAVSAVLSATHCVVLESGAGNLSPEYVYLLGLVIGRGIPVLVLSGDAASARYRSPKATGSAVRVFSDGASLLSDLTGRFDAFVAEEEKQLALTDLFAAGIPFTADCFATYIAKDDDQKCTEFFKAGMPVDSRDSLGVPMLCIATRNDCFAKVRWLIENGADINAVAADRGYTAVMDAVWRKNADVTKYLIDKGADLSVISSDGQSILVLAVGNGNTKIIDMLLAAGADPDIQDGMGMSARQYAELFKKEPILEVFRRYNK